MHLMSTCALVLGIAATNAGCGSDDVANGMNSDPDTGTEPDASTNGGASDTCQDGLYALATSVPSGQDSSSMFVATHCGLGKGELSLDEVAHLDPGLRHRASSVNHDPPGWFGSRGTLVSRWFSLCV